MEKKKTNRLGETLLIVVIVICMGLIILQLHVNINNVLNHA